MTSWVYVFSRFTAEALLFEALAIFLLCAGYAAFWILRKRRYGALEAASNVPVGVVKGYLNELILDAEQLRAQLFGLLASSGLQIAQSPLPLQGVSINVSPSASNDPEALKKVALLELKMVEQAKAMESMMADKARIEQELAHARAKGGSPAPAAPSGDLGKLQEKIQQLEARLAEYSVIEDDLANLKRLQQENAQLRASLGQSGMTQSAKPAAPTPTAEPARVAVAAPAPIAAPASIPAAEPSPLEAMGGSDAAFENLVDQVEQSLQPAAPAAAAPAAPAPSTSAPAAGSMAKSDEDLVAEFEKMLNS
ncbi:MAG: hypothetical protein NDJ89_16185 [Oligoflexia bacterium]|nr:hypothetical protein [Oligoflexia bacterium]